MIIPSVHRLLPADLDRGDAVVRVGAETRSDRGLRLLELRRLRDVVIGEPLLRHILLLHFIKL